MNDENVELNKEMEGLKKNLKVLQINTDTLVYEDETRSKELEVNINLLITFFGLLTCLFGMNWLIDELLIAIWGNAYSLAAGAWLIFSSPFHFCWNMFRGFPTPLVHHLHKKLSWDHPSWLRFELKVRSHFDPFFQNPPQHILRFSPLYFQVLMTKCNEIETKYWELAKKEKRQQNELNRCNVTIEAHQKAEEQYKDRIRNLQVIMYLM